MPKKIAILRANALGDFIFALPAIQALRETFPDTEIVYLGKAWHKEFLKDRPGPIDRVELIPPYPGVGEVENFDPDKTLVEAFFHQMHEEKFDIAIQMHGGGYYSNPFLKKLGARLSVGLKAFNAAPLDISVPYINTYSEILRYLEVVSHLGATTKHLEPQVAVTQADLNEISAILEIPDKNRLAIIHPGASDLRRRWPAEYFAAITDFLTEQGYQVCLTGLESERHVIENVLARTARTSSIVNLCGRLSLSGMTGLLSLADIMVANDTGPLHLARALRTATVGIFWTVNSITAVPMTTSLHRSLISWDPYCPLCGTDCVKPDFYTETCKHEVSFTANITVEEVKQALEELLLFTTIKSPV